MLHVELAGHLYTERSLVAVGSRIRDNVNISYNGEPVSDLKGRARTSHATLCYRCEYCCYFSPSVECTSNRHIYFQRSMGRCAPDPVGSPCSTHAAFVAGREDHTTSCRSLADPTNPDN
jgi:hypothetical protein